MVFVFVTGRFDSVTITIIIVSALSIRTGIIHSGMFIGKPSAYTASEGIAITSIK